MLFNDESVKDEISLIKDEIGKMFIKEEFFFLKLEWSGILFRKFGCKRKRVNLMFVWSDLYDGLDDSFIKIEIGKKLVCFDVVSCC